MPIENSPHVRHWFGLLLLALIVVGADQGSKAIVASQLAIGQSWAPIPAFATVFEITRSANSGAAFGIFQGSNFILLLLSLGMTGGILVYFVRLTAVGIGQAIVLGILLGGVLGNLLDRLRLGTVVDFIHWQLPGVISNVSNVADHAIVFSVIALLLIQWRAGIRQGRSQQADPVP